MTAAVALLTAAVVVPTSPALAKAAPTTSAPAERAADGWVGTWSASPAPTGNRGFKNQTLRQTLRTSIGGDAARVQLSNAFGTEAVTIADVHIADQLAGPAIDPSTDRSVTFGGKSSVTIPAGGKAVSDEVGYPVKPLSDVAISFYSPNEVVNATQHWDAWQTNYIADGNVAGEATLTNYTTNGSYTLLANLDVRNSAAVGSVVALGASITDAFNSPFGANLRWTNALATRLGGRGQVVGVLNQGISGQGLIGGDRTSAVNRFQRDVLDQAGVRWVVIADMPINDLNNFNPSSAELIAALRGLIGTAHDKGVQVLCATLTPFAGWPTWSQDREESRKAYNAFVRGSASGCDAVADFATATQDPAAPERFLGAFDAGDHLHPNRAGLQAMADVINLDTFGAPTGPVVAPAKVIGLRSLENMQIVGTTPDGAQLIADRSQLGVWEQFDKIPQADGSFALRSHANGKFVTATTDVPLTPSATKVGLEEKFIFVANGNGSTSLRSVANGRYVAAEDAGAKPLIANRDSIGPWEQFAELTPQ
ncbi:GDSL-type esterase/lipase family protein [Actinoplanes sp. TRM 88003]|uniref:GDSL-type esterase/lipase family protein n=1 Tax=Paractinoplanes aksuensis TaxID=2939490 RepID=A0ABT1E3T8_9ACTN|nr:GDSL-type esterase/lipase family protein [Actinoplanes aksuensis]MCO8277805.1 GDSL-type esterase/lipase family protein [Actinoplanes aksuensis]